MKKVIAIIVIIILSITVYLFTKEKDLSVKTAGKAVALIKEKYPEYNDYPSDNLPPKSIETVQIAEGWRVGMYMEGSGVQGILKANCFLVTNSGTVTEIGQFAGEGPAQSIDLTTCTPKETNSIIYTNTQYGFSFSLPNTWEGYSIVSDTWQGNPTNTATKATSGPKLLIRNPKWTSVNPHQDIPIMIFTLTQWQDIQDEKLIVSPAPIPPSELGRNATYVFALPPRYNYAYPTGWEEVEKIIQSKPLAPLQ